MTGRKDHFVLAGAMLLSFLSSWLTVFLLYRGSYEKEVFFGWALSVAFNLSGLTIKRLAIGKEIRHFFFYALILNSLNLAIFFGLSCFILKKTTFASGPFILSLFIAYFVMLIYDIRKLKAAYTLKENSLT